MTTRNFLRLSLLAPLVVPLPAFAFLRMEDLSGTLGMVRMVLVFSLLVGGVPYAVFAAALAWRLRDADTRSWIRATWCAPVYFALLIGGLGMLLELSGRPSLEEAADTGALLAVFGLAVGYAYVLLVHGLRLLLQREGFLASSADTA